MQTRDIRKLVQPLKSTPLHPQWLMSLKSNRLLRQELQKTSGFILDIGCSDGGAKQYIPNESHYIGLDYLQTATDWYNTVPDIYADAQTLPIEENTVDLVLLLDVLEHIPNSEQCINEIYRALKPGGKIIIQVPFLYPLHDVPLDFQRWTSYGLENLLSNHKLKIVSLNSEGTDLETCALLINLTISRILIRFINKKNPLLILGVFAPFFICLTNLTGYIFSKVSSSDASMPYRYIVMAEKSN